MASNINPYNIDGTFPIANQDNSSQGFRDNFTNIRNNLIFAQNEISDLQSKVIVTSALTGQAVTNDMAGTQLVRPQLTAWTQSQLDVGAVSGRAVLNFNDGNFQKIITAGPVELDFINWPSSSARPALGYGSMRVWIVVTSIGHTLTLPDSVTIGINEIAGSVQNDDETHTITFDTPGDYVYDFSSIDGGANYLVFDLTHNRSTFRDPSFYFNSTVSPSLFIGFTANGLPVAQSIEGDDDDVLNCHEGINSISSGDLWTATPNNPRMTYSELPGYHMYASRGNIDQGNISPIRSNDPISYITARGFTGNATSNTWQNLSSIQFAATGSNVQYGLGGNISFWTAPDGTSSPSRMVQAASIENDRNVKAFANLTVSGNTVQYNGTINTNYLYLTRTTGGTLVANVTVEKYYLDSASSATLAAQTITLPTGAENGRMMEFNALCPITTTTFNGGTAKWIPSTVFNTGNVSVKLMYSTTASAWLRR